MILIGLILIPLLGGVAAWGLGRRSAGGAFAVATAALAGDLALALLLWGHATGGPATYEVDRAWIPALGIRFHLALDGLSLLLVLLTLFLGLMATIASWRSVRERAGFYCFNLLWTLAGVTGVFLAMDLFLFYLFWELMLVPMYALFFWGQEGRAAAAMKFFIYTQVSGLFMLLAILALMFLHAAKSGVYTFDYGELIGTETGAGTALWLLLGFFAAFAVKLGVVPFHGWLPDAYTHAPNPAAAVLAGAMAKTGAYGMIRFVVPLFPGAAASLQPVGMLLGVIGILYGAVMAFGQTDLKRLIAYSSISSMGFALLGIAAWDTLALQGAVMQLVSHGVSIAALFLVAGMLQERVGTRDLSKLGGLWTSAPRMGAVMTVLALAALALPGLGNFVGEFLVILGAWPVSKPLAALAAGGMVLTLVYAVRMLQTIFHGPAPADRSITDLSGREWTVSMVMVLALVALGLYPRPVLDASEPVVQALQGAAAPEPPRGNPAGLLQTALPARHAAPAGRAGGDL